MALLYVQYSGHSGPGGGGSAAAGIALALMVVAILISATALLVKDYRRAPFRAGAALVREAELWLQDQP